MQFTVPQFINYEAKVIGPFTFKHFIIIAVAGIICFAALLKTPAYVYIPVWAVVGGGASVLVFVKFSGRSPLTLGKNFFFYTISPKMYLWKRKIIPTRIVKEKPKKKKEVEEKTVLRVVKKSKLKELSTKIETSKK